MTTIKDIYDFIDSFAPFDTALDFDNVGILVGDKNATVKKALLSLDVTEEVIEEADHIKAQLIITHHPVIFRAIKSLDSHSLPYILANKNLNVISAHTNLDLSPEGVNFHLAKRLGLENITVTKDGIAVGDIENPRCWGTFTSRHFAEFVKEHLNCKGVRYTDIQNDIKKVAVGGGACGEYIYLAKELGTDAFVTGEIKHNFIVESHALQLTVVDAGHYKTEDVVINPLKEKLQKTFDEVTFVKSQTFTDYIDYI